VAKKVMFSVHVGDSMGHVFRTRDVARYLLCKGYDIVYSVPRKAIPFLDGYVEKKYIRLNDQNYSYAQLPFRTSSIVNDYYRHALTEKEIYEQYRPDFLVGDSGLLTCTYRPEKPFLKIFNRIYVELGDEDMDSPYSMIERNLIKAQAETVINETRSLLGIVQDFKYNEFASPPALVNGASYFLDDLKPIYRRVGINMRLKLWENGQPHLSNCFVSFGTGLTKDRAVLVSNILEHLEQRFEKIYISFGTKIRKDELYQPANAIMKPIFDTVPPDIGVLVCHGGYGIIHLGIELGIPIISIPFQFEHYSNSCRMEKLGAGINAGTYNPANFKGIYQTFEVDWDKFWNAIDNPKSIRKVKEVKDDFKSKGDNLLGKYVEEFILSNM
jgi:UDP:flavonoid glycosyltransferase YjiC (YdhE family)